MIVLFSILITCRFSFLISQSRVNINNFIVCEYTDMAMFRTSALGIFGKYSICAQWADLNVVTAYICIIYGMIVEPVMLCISSCI